MVRAHQLAAWRSCGPPRRSSRRARGPLARARDRTSIAMTEDHARARPRRHGNDLHLYASATAWAPSAPERARESSPPLRATPPTGPRTTRARRGAGPSAKAPRRDPLRIRAAWSLRRGQDAPAVGGLLHHVVPAARHPGRSALPVGDLGHDRLRGRRRLRGRHPRVQLRRKEVRAGRPADPLPTTTSRAPPLARARWCTCRCRWSGPH